MSRNIDRMSKEDITLQLLRIASYLQTTYNLEAEHAANGWKSPAGAKALGRQEICATICDDLYITFGIEAGAVTKED